MLPRRGEGPEGSAGPLSMDQRADAGREVETAAHPSQMGGETRFPETRQATLAQEPRPSVCSSSSFTSGPENVIIVLFGRQSYVDPPVTG